MDIIELIQPKILKKEGFEPITIAAGTLLKVKMENPSSYLVEDESGISFLVNFADEGVLWKKI